MGDTGVGRPTGTDPSAGRRAVVPGFELVDELGRGARTVVYRARRVDGDGPDVAIKILRDPSDDAATVAAAFRREAALLARVTHPSLAAVHAAGEAGGRPYLVLEHVDGAALSRLIEDGPLREADVLTVAIDAAGALGAAHRMRLVHRDVKPQNLLVSRAGRATLIDFDLATWSGELASGESVTGTLVYSAPEQTGMLARPVDARTDLYALGVVLFECVAGHPPFTADDVGELLRLHTAEPAPDVRTLRPDCSPGLAAIIARLLAKDPDDRYQSASGLITDLRRVVEDPRDWHVEQHAAPGAADVDGSDMPPLSGRASELLALTTRWERSGSGGGPVLVEGTAGTGKTRLAQELLTRVARDGHRPLHVRCTTDGQRPLRAVAIALEHHVRQAQQLPGTQRAEAEQRLRAAAGTAAPLLLGLSPALDAVLDADHAALAEEDRQEQVAAAVAGFLSALAELEERLLLVIDDAHRIDVASERVLAHVCAGADRTRLMIVLVAPTDTLVPLEGRIGVPFEPRITLGPLAPPDVTSLIARELGGAQVPASVADQLMSRTGGNPFTVLEFLRHLIEAGGLQPSWGTWVLDGALLDRLHLPSDVLDLVLARLEGLGKPARRLLATAAVQGTRFDAGVLIACGTVPADQVHEAVAAAARHRVVEHVADGIYTFLHHELQATLLADLDATALQRTHHRIACVLQARATDDLEHIYALARHRVAAGVDVEPQRCHEACVAAGDAALAQQAPNVAAEFLGHAARAATAAGLTPDVRFHQTFATALSRTGDFAGAREHVDVALALERDGLRRAELCNLLATIQHSAGDGDRAIESVRQGLAELGVAPPRSTPLLIASTAARFVAGLLVRGSRRRFATARGQRRRRDLTEASLLETGAQAAVVSIDNLHLIAFLLRAVLPANRVGPSPQRARVLATLGFLTAIAKAPGVGARLCAAAHTQATDARDPALIALTGYMRAVVESIAQARTAPVADALEEHGRWLEMPYYLASVAHLIPHLSSVGYTGIAQLWVDRARRRLRLGAEPLDAFPIECMAGAVEAIGGHAAAAEATLQAAIDRLPAGVTAQQRLHLAWARLIILTEQGELGDALDKVIAEIDAAEMPPGHFHALAICYTVTFARLAQAHAAGTRAERDRRLSQAHRGLRTLRRGRSMPRLRAGRLGLRAWALHLSGRDRAALRMLHRALRAADGADAPLLSFDLMRTHGRILRSLGLEPEARRQARSALGLANEFGWEYRARWLRGEFDVHDSRGSSGHSRSRAGSSMSSSSGPRPVHEHRRMDAVTQVSATAASVLDPEELIRVALDAMLRLLSAERAFLFLADQHPDERGSAGTPRDHDAALRPHRGCAADGSDLRALTGYSSTLVDRVWETGQALVVTGAEQGAALGSESAVLHGLRSILVAPLQLKGRMLGVVYLDSRVARGIFTDDDVDLLVTITQQVAAALETARAAQLEGAVRAANRQRDLAETLRTSMADLNSTLEPAEVLQRLLATMAATLPGDHAVLARSEQGRMRLLALDDASGCAHPPAVGEDVDALLTTLRTVTAPVPGSDPRAPRLPDEVAALLGGPRSWLAVPVAPRGEAVGVVLLGSQDAGSYTEVEIEVAAAMAQQAAVAHDNAELFSRVRQLATTDVLTGLSTRRHFWEMAEQQLATASRHDRPLAVMMLDVDHFKTVNDTYGHAAGDAVLRVISERMRAMVRESDVVGRYGGEEFALMLPETTDAAPLAERLRAAVAGTEVPTDQGAVRVTISVGVSYRRAGDDLDRLLGRADSALYRSKAEGRNRVTTT